MVTLTGNWVNPHSFTFSAEDAARHLGRLPRFGGTVKGWWTGLQHSLLVSRLARKANKGARIELLALWHDAHEAITGDWCRPWKPDTIRRMQAVLDTVITASVGLPTFSEAEHADVKIFDDVAGEIEAHIMAPTVVTRHPDSFGTAAEAERYRREGVFDGLWTGDLGFDMRSTWEADGCLVREFLERHQGLMRMCDAELRAARTVKLDNDPMPRDDREEQG